MAKTHKVFSRFNPRHGRVPATLAASILSLCAALAFGAARAEDYPTRPVTFVIPSSAGTTGDLMARIIGPKLSARWGVPVVVDNKVGASGAIGIESVAKAAPDGYTFLVGAAALTSLAALRSDLPYDPIRDFAPVVLMGTSSLVLAVNNDVPAKTLPEFLDYVKKQPPGKLNYATPGIGSVHHMITELFQQEAGISMMHVPYKSTAGAIADLIAGQVQASFIVLQTAAPVVEAGKLRLLAVASKTRAKRFPDVPTLAELGLPGAALETWWGIVAPAGTPDAVVRKVNADINSLLKDPEVQAAWDKMGVTAAGGTPQELGENLKKELQTWKRVAARAKIAQ